MDYHIVRSLIVFICGMLAGAVGVQLRRQFEKSIVAATARDRVTNLFGQHVSPQVVERLMAEGTNTASDTRRVAVMFVDFRSFTAAARSRSPQEVVDRLDGAFTVLVEIVDRHGGIVNKFMGDGFLALFGAPFETPDAMQHGVEAAREMLVAMTRDNETSSWTRIAVRASIFDGRTLLAQKTFVRDWPAPTPDAAGGARALADASDAVIGELMLWLAAQPLKR